MLDLFADSWAAAAWDAIEPALPMLCAVAVLAFAARIAWSSGVISFAPIAIAAVGGYLAANLLVAGSGLALALVAAAIAGFWLGLVVAIMLGRLPVHVQTFASLALAGLIAPVALGLPGWTGGKDGIDITAIMPPGEPAVIFVSLAVVASVVVAAAALDRSWFGVAARATRHGEALAASMGIQPRAIQSLAFGLTGLLAGVAGALLVLAAGTATPATFPLSLGFLALAAALVGGAFHWSGPALGSLIFALPAAMLGPDNSGALNIASAIAVVVLLIFLPRGLLDPRDSLRREARERRRQRRATPAFAPPVDDEPRRRSGRHGLQTGYNSRLNAAIKRRTGGGP